MLDNLLMLYYCISTITEQYNNTSRCKKDKEAALWSFDSNQPIYLQLIQQIKMKIISGEYPPGGRMPTSRELATDAKVNPNTVQKAYMLLEQEGMIMTDRTIGRYVTDDDEKISVMRDEAAETLAANYIDGMRAIGFSEEQSIAKLLSKKESGK